MDTNDLTLFSKNKRVTSPQIKKYDSYRGYLSLNNKNKDNISLNSYESKNKLLFRNRSKISMKNSLLSTTRTNNFNTARDHIKNKTFYSNKNNDSKINKNKISNNDIKFIIKNELDNTEKNNNDSYELKIEEYQSKSKKKIVIPPIITNQINKDIHLNNQNKNLYNSLFNEKQDNKSNNNSINLKLFINKHKNELSFNSNNLLDNTSKKNTMKSESKSMNKFKKYLDSIEDNITLKNNDITKNEEIQLKCYLKDIPDFFNKINSKKNMYFGMNKKALFHNNALFTEFK